jgi:hypothetical protein
MNAVALRFHHFGLAVRAPEPAQAYLRSLGYRLGEAVYDPHQNVHLIMGEHDDQPAVEIIYPGNGPGPVDVLVQRHESGVIYHPCYETPDLAQTLEQFSQAGIRVDCVAPPTPAPLFNGRKVSFYRVRGIGLIELLE